MAYRLLSALPPQFETANGLPAVGHYLFIYLYNTTTPSPLYTNSSGSGSATSFQLNSRGVPQSAGGTPVELFGSTEITGGYKILLCASNDSTDVVQTFLGPIYPTLSGSSVAEGVYESTTIEGALDAHRVASMSALVTGTWTGIDEVQVMGFYGGWSGSTAGPKGASKWHYDGTTGGTQTTNTSAAIITAMASGRVISADGRGWRLSHSQKFNFHQFGAAGDWNGTSGTDDTLAIQAGVDFVATAATSNNAIDIESFGEAKYRITAGIKMKGFVRMRFNGAYVANDYDGGAFLGGSSFSADAQFLHLHDVYVEGISPLARTNQKAVDWDGVYVDSSLNHVIGINMGGDGMRLDTVNAVSVNNCWMNISGGRNLRMINCSAVNINGGAYEGPGVTAFSPVAYAVGSRAISIENTIYGDYRNTINGVQTERSSIGVYADYSNGLAINGLNCHNTGGPTSQAMVWLTAETDQTTIVGLSGESYSVAVFDVATTNSVTTSGDAVNYTQGNQYHAAPASAPALSVLSGYLATGDLRGLLGYCRVGFQTVSVADDAIAVFAAVGSNNRAVYLLVNQDRGIGNTLFAADSTGAPISMGDSGNVSYSATALTAGSGDGTDGNVNVYLNTTTTIGVKNRLGFTTRFALFTFSVA